jgi:hypothetical protein
MLKKSKVEISVKKLSQLNKSRKINLEMAIQRNANIWDIERKSLLIHSFIEGYPVPPYYATEEKGVLTFLDGKQRISTTLAFLNDEFVLTNIPTIKFNEQEIDINGKKFSELDADIQEEINSTMLLINRFDDITDEEVEIMFFRLNNGVPLSKFELTRCKASHIIGFVTDITKHKIFDKMNFSEKQLIRYADQENMLQILNILYSDNPSFSGKDLQEFAEKLTISDKQKEEITAYLDYLESALTTIKDKVYRKFMKRVHLPIIIKTIKQAVNFHVGAEQFGNFLVKFYWEENKPEGTSYNNASRSKSASSENINKRKVAMQNSFSKFFAGLEALQEVGTEVEQDTDTKVDKEGNVEQKEETETQQDIITGAENDTVVETKGENETEPDKDTTPENKDANLKEAI